MRNGSNVMAFVVRARLLFCGLSVASLLVSTAQAEWIPTNFGIGADAEVRESNPTQNRGNSTEIASRVRNAFIAGDGNDGGDRNSAIYTKFDLTGVIVPDPFVTAFRMTYRNNNLNASRIQDTITPNPNVRTGLAIYGLDPMAAGANWDEMTITYLNAPGITIDGDVGTKDFNSDLTFLGTVNFPEIGNQNWLPVGDAIIFESENLHTFIANAIAGGATHVTLVTTVIHGGDAPFNNWINLNYLFNPKEQTTLNNDPNHDADTTDPNNPLGSPFSGADNMAGAFSPSLLIASPPPEPDPDPDMDPNSEADPNDNSEGDPNSMADPNNSEMDPNCGTETQPDMENDGMSDCGAGLCGAGSLSLLPFMLLGIAAMRKRR